MVRPGFFFSSQILKVCWPLPHALCRILLLVCPDPILSSSSSLLKRRDLDGFLHIYPSGGKLVVEPDMWPGDGMVEIDAAFIFACLCKVRGRHALRCWWVLILFFVVTDEIGGCAGW
jgi:hypothetical protein